ncbi:DUF1194 domain-containing protein [Flaviflagellibacter deserti]|uniref:DUF1194 domain-containing protein n=1 Tax=Flaviflagellibacter deserti TaxID=2267266 RepID=A0ABV9Z2G5_9HYPH
MRTSPLMALAFGALAIFLQNSPARAQQPVDVALVLLADGSGSIDPEEFRMQRDGYADAITSPEVLAAVRSNARQKIAIVFVEWGAPESQNVIIDWTVIDGEVAAKRFADELRQAPKLTFGYNSISNAIDLGVKLLVGAPVAADREVIDVSGDGPNIGGRDIHAARDDAVAKDITVNALAIRRPGSGVALSNNIPLEDYYRLNVIGGPGAFVEVAQGRENFAEAIRRKLVLELAAAGAGPRILALGE